MNIKPPFKGLYLGMDSWPISEVKAKDLDRLRNIRSNSRSVLGEQVSLRPEGQGVRHAEHIGLQGIYYHASFGFPDNSPEGILG